MSEKAPLLDTAAIQALIPHRYPFLLVDQVLEIVPLQRILAVKAVTFNEPWFAGHFPGHPVMPGVLVIEALAQAGGILVCSSMTPQERASRYIYFTGIDHARFRRPVTPGSLLELRCAVVRNRGAVFRQRGEAFVDGQLCVEVDFMAMFTDKGA